MVVLIGLGCVAILAGLLVFALFLVVNNIGVPLQGRKKGIATPKVVLGVFAHPDDEIMVAGTLAKWQKQGTKVHLLYLTHGEDGPTGGLVEKKDLGPARAQELGEVKKILKADSLTILDYPDRTLNTIAMETLECKIEEAINRCQPDAVICFDNTIGLYGHTDHAWAGRCCQTLLAKTPGPVRWQLVMTLCPKMIALALKVSKTFRERYHGESGLPNSNLAVPIRHTGKQKKQVALAHKTQYQVVEDVQPFLTKLPAFIYYRIFAREYFEVTPLFQAEKQPTV